MWRAHLAADDCDGATPRAGDAYVVDVVAGEAAGGVVTGSAPFGVVTAGPPKPGSPPSPTSDSADACLRGARKQNSRFASTKG